jgi:anthranilate phosphoribosyltransferase
VIIEYLRKLVNRSDLSEEEAMDAMTGIVEGRVSAAQLGALLIALAMKKECVDELSGFVKAIRRKQLRITPRLASYIDTNGTGGDGKHTINISTAAAFVIAAGGVPVAKYGGRSFSSRSGSADLMDALGVNLQLTPAKAQECLEAIGLTFMYSPVYSDAMKVCETPRKELGVRTIFNMVGPLTNPAAPTGHLLGVYSQRAARLIIGALVKQNVQNALVVHGCDGLDEITLSGPTDVLELNNGRVRNYQIHPSDVGLQIRDLSLLKGGQSQENAALILRVLKGEKGALRDVIILNSAAGLYVGKKVSNIAEGVECAAEVIDSGMALQKLQDLVRFSQISPLASGCGKDPAN